MESVRQSAGLMSSALFLLLFKEHEILKYTQISINNNSNNKRISTSANM